MNDQTHHPLPNDLVVLVVVGAILIALAVVLPITHSGALAIAGATLVQVALGAWTVRTLERLHADDQADHAPDRFNLPRAYVHHTESSDR